jgi:spore coat protein CotH
MLYVVSEVINAGYLEENFTYAGGVLYKAELGGGNSATYDLYFTSQQAGFAGRGFPGGGSNALVERFLANATFKGIYERKLIEIYRVGRAMPGLRA